MHNVFLEHATFSILQSSLLVLPQKATSRIRDQPLKVYTAEDVAPESEAIYGTLKAASDQLEHLHFRVRNILALSVDPQFTIYVA